MAVTRTHRTSLRDYYLAYKGFWPYRCRNCGEIMYDRQRWPEFTEKEHQLKLSFEDKAA